MSAITGIYHLDGQHVDSSILSRMTGALVCRGPDGIDTWQAGPVGLGHCMLRTTPESLHEHLPFTSDDGVLTITADARIDNREELISDLDLRHHAGIMTDSFLILSAYQRWGETCVDHLLGDFAFVLWDARQCHLFCARDHMGVKPFYYYRSDTVFACASEIKALFCVPGIPREIHEKSLAFRLAGIDYDPAVTLYNQIHRLPAACTMTVSPSKSRTNLYWSLDPHREIHFDTDEGYETAFRTIFIEAVRCRLRSAFPIGATLSGGLDSSSVVVIARHLLQQDDTQLCPLHTFSAVFDAVPVCDERTWIQYVLAGGGLTPHFIYPERISPLIDIHQRIAQNEGPPLYPQSYTYETMYQTAKDSGVRVVLSGEWGDGIVSYGRGALLELLRCGKFLRSIREIISLSKNFGTKKRTIIWNDVLLPIIPAMFRHRSHHNPMKWIQDDFAHRTGLVEYLLRLRKTELNYTTSRECHIFDLSSFPISLTLEEVNKNAGAHAIDICYPFLDRRVIEFCLALPPEQRIRDGYTRAIERESLAGYLPMEIRQRTSKAIADPYIRYSLVKFEGKNLKDLLFYRPDVLGVYVDLDFIHELYRKLMAGTAFNLIPLWRTVVVTLWLHEEKMRALNDKSDKKPL